MSVIIKNSWTRLRSFTGARLALGRAGDSLPTREVLEFGLAHAQARDAVHHAMNTERIAGQLKERGCESITVQSAAHDRAAYLRRPDLGRRLSEESRSYLRNCHPEQNARREAPSIVFIIADGLSAIAPERHAIPLLLQMHDMLQNSCIVIATQARVALGDEIGELLQAEMTAMLIGERPGLSSPDSLGIYLTYKPRIGCTDVDRNCISNVRSEGLSYEAAAHKLRHLMFAARRLGQSGIALKDESDQLHLSE